MINVASVIEIIPPDPSGRVLRNMTIRKRLAAALGNRRKEDLPVSPTLGPSIVESFS